MNITNTLHKLSELHKKKFLTFSLCIFLPNLSFLLFAYFTQTSRTLFNLDYILVSLLFILSIKYKIIKIFAVIGLILSILIDALMLIIQIFPFLSLDGVIYLAKFVFIAPLIYKIGCLLLIVNILLLIYLFFKLPKNITYYKETIVICLLLLLVGYFNYFYKFKYHNNEYLGGGGTGHNNDYIVYSQTVLFNHIFNNKWTLAIKKDTKPNLIKFDEIDKKLDSNEIPFEESFILYKYRQNGANKLTKSSNKILFILVESLGSMQNQDIDKEVLKNIIALQEDKLVFLNNIYDIEVLGPTVASELRELCSYIVGRIGGYNFNKNSADEFKHCLPNQLQRQGFNTIALHGASSRLYERYSLYEKLGFKERYFLENFLDKKKCYAYHGVCDSELFDFIVDKFRTNESLFFYWMTLTAHAPYHKSDILTNNRFKCEQFQIKAEGTICRNLKLHTQFFDRLAEIIKKNNMNGVEVMIVGDHMPPIYTKENQHLYLKQDFVPVIHFKIKD